MTPLIENTKITSENIKDVIEIVDLLLDHSNNSIIRKTFINAFKYNTFNNRLYGQYKLFGTKTMRLTSKYPNLLNLPSTGSIYAKPIKRCFQAEPNHIFCMIDLAATEDRVMANLSKDTNKCAIFTQNIDGHCLNSYYYFKDEIEAILPRQANEELYDYIKRYKKAIEEGNAQLKSIRQRGKKCSFSLQYGAYPNKVAENLRCSKEEAERIFNQYHNELYKDITLMREKVLKKANICGKIHLGLGCYINSDNGYRDIRTLNNATCQFWNIITLLTIDKVNDLIRQEGLQDDIKLVSSIYDSIYYHVRESSNIIRWLNNTLIPIFTKDFLKHTIVHNEAEMEIGYNWADTVAISNRANIFEINKAIKKAKSYLA